MARTSATSLVYLALCISVFLFLDGHDLSYFGPISSPIFGQSAVYTQFLRLWLLISVASLVFVVFLSPTFANAWKEFALVPINAMLVSCGYFWLVMRLYFLSFSTRDIFIETLPIVGVAALMILIRFSGAQIVKFNLLVLFAILPLALQYALVAVEHTK